MPLHYPSSVGYKWVVLAVASIGAFMAPLDGSIVNLALPRIASSLKADLASTAWVPTAYLLVLATLQTTLGRLADIKGRKRLYTLGLLVFVAASILCGTSQSINSLIGFRVVQAVGSALMFSVSAALITDAFPSAERGKALGINVTMVYLGLTMGPVLGGFLVHYFGWRSVFYINVPIGVVAFILASWKLRSDRPVPSGRRFDLLGAGTFIVFLASILLLLTFGGEYGWRSIYTQTLVGSSAVFGGLFIMAESRWSADPMMPLSLFTKNRLFAAGNLTALLAYTTSMGIGLLLSFHLQIVMKRSPAEAGLILLAQPIAMVVLAPVSGWLYDRMGSRILASTGMAVRSVGLLLLTRLALSSQPTDVMIPLVVVGVGMGLFSSPNTSSIMGSVPRHQLGLASGTIGMIRTMGAPSV